MSERRYQALLCLVQVAVPDPDAPDGVRTEVIDPLGRRARPTPRRSRGCWPTRTWRWWCTPGARTWRSCGAPGDTEVRNVFDTQVAAGFLGLGNQEGYESLVRKVLDVQAEGLGGLHAWDRRPLTAQQLEYAADDARLLLTLGERLEQRLDEQGRLEWAREECRALEESSDERDPERVYERLPRLARLGERPRASRASWWSGARTSPSRMDRPPGYVLPDQALIELARRAPTDRDGLEQIRGLPAQTLHRRGDQLLAAIARGARAQRAAEPRSTRPRATPPTRRSSRSPRRWCASARWRAAWRWS